MDPFDLLGVEPRFDIDPAIVEQRHRDLSRALHPDRFVGRPASERRLALTRAIEMNDAWRRIRDPVSRSEALLARYGIDASESSGARASPQLLMDMMEQREELAETRASRNKERLSVLTTAMRDREKNVLVSLQNAFSQDPHSAPPLLAELRFVRRYLEESSDAENDIQ